MKKLIFSLSFYLNPSPLTVDQTTDIVLYSADKYTKTVLSKEFGYVDRKPKKLKQSNIHITVANYKHTIWCLFMYEFICVLTSLERQWKPVAPTRTP